MLIIIWHFMLKCKGLCELHTASKPTDGKKRYDSGQRRCNTCNVFLKTADVNCLCCGAVLRTKPRSNSGKKKNAADATTNADNNTFTTKSNVKSTVAKPTSKLTTAPSDKSSTKSLLSGVNSARLQSTDTARTRITRLGGMDWGLENRIASIIRPSDNRALMLAVDHGYFLGPTERLEEPAKVIAPLLKYCDSLMLTRGVQRTSVPATTQTPMVLRVSGGSSIIGDDLSQEDITVSIKDAIRLNASALALSVFVGSKYEYQTIVNLGKLVGQAQEYGIPVLAVTAVGKDLGKDARYLSLACRIAAEQGAHIVKTYYCDDFERVTKSCPVPIIVAGGKKIPERDALELTYNSIQGGAVGVDMGRNIWQSEHPVAMIRAVYSIVHKNNTVEQAYKMYRELASDSHTG